MKPWSLKSAIQKQVDIEDRHAWATSKTKVTLPEYQKPQRMNLTLFFKNSVEMIRNGVLELRP